MTTIRGRLVAIVLALLAISLAVNFLVAGFFAARIVNLGEPSAIERIVALGARAFPAEIRRAILAEVLGDGSELRSAVREFADSRKKLLATMRAAPFDPAALDAAFAEVRERTDTLQEIGQRIVGDAVKSASPEARAKITLPGE